MLNPKIADHHLMRKACIYIRQSTMAQVRFNQESTERQYNLADQAKSLGWMPEQIRILDGDLAQSREEGLQESGDIDSQTADPGGGKPSVGHDGTVVAGMPGAGSGGGLGDLLKGRLGGLLAGGAAGGALSGGLGDLLKQFQQAGQGEVASSWVGSGQNKAIAPKDWSEALGSDQISGLIAQTGLSRDELLAGLSEQLPRVVDHLTPDGRLPTEQEMSRLI